MLGLCLTTAKQADSSLQPLQWHLRYLPTKQACSKQPKVPQPFATVVASIDICLQYKPAVSNHQDAAAVLETQCLVSATVLQSRLTAAFCHSSGIYGYLPAIQACSEQSQRCCSSAGDTAFGVCLSTANQADSSLLPLQWHLLTSACNTSLQ